MTRNKILITKWRLSLSMICDIAHVCTFHRSSDRNSRAKIVAFGEALAIDLTKCHAELSRTSILGVLSVAFGEIFG